jgi:hypothetical protein
MRVSEQVKAIKDGFMYHAGLARVLGLEESVFVCWVAWRVYRNPDGTETFAPATAEDVQRETGLSPDKQQRRIRTKLIKLGILKEENQRSLHRMIWGINWDMLDAMVDGEAVAQRAKAPSPNGREGHRPTGEGLSPNGRGVIAQRANSHRPTGVSYRNTEKEQSKTEKHTEAGKPAGVCGDVQSTADGKTPAAGVKPADPVMNAVVKGDAIDGALVLWPTWKSQVNEGIRVSWRTALAGYSAETLTKAIYKEHLLRGSKYRPDLDKVADECERLQPLVSKVPSASEALAKAREQIAKEEPMPLMPDGTKAWTVIDGKPMSLKEYRKWYAANHNKTAPIAKALA